MEITNFEVFVQVLIIDAFVKSRNIPLPVIPAKAGIQSY